MAYSDSMVLFEIAVEELKSYNQCGKFKINARFGDVFTVRLRDPNEFMKQMTTRGNKKNKKGKCTRKIAPIPVPTVIPGTTALVASDIESLISSMIRCPIEITIFSKDDPYSMGLVDVPWTDVHLNYISNLKSDPQSEPAIVKGTYTAYDEYTSKRVAKLKLKVQLSHLNNNISVDANLENKYIKKYSTMIHDYNVPEFETGIIKTIYSGGKKKFRDVERRKKRDYTHSRVEDKILDFKQVSRDDNWLGDPMTANTQNREGNQMKKEDCRIITTEGTNNESSIEQMDNPNKSFATLIRSQTNLEENKIVALTKYWSSSSFEIKEKLDNLNYIFGNPGRPFRKQVYCVSYLTVDQKNETADTLPASSSSPTRSRADTKSPSSYLGNYSFVLCDSQCDINDGNITFKNTCNLDLPLAASQLITVKKCKNVVGCDFKEPPPPTLTDTEEQIYVDFRKADRECCVKKVEEISGGVTGKMVIAGPDPCFCTCECKFGFIKKTTYCAICGGYELTGPEIKEIKSDKVRLPYPCPIFHGKVDNKIKKGGKVKPSGASVTADDTRSEKSRKFGTTTEKRGPSLGGSEKRSFESEKGSEKKKFKRDPRFKFNYGFKGIPPLIGHSRCALPCTGTMHPVPRHMGWLWTADNIPGLKFRPYWKPGAANKHVVRMLKIARNPEQEMNKKRKKVQGKKKRPLKRPLLIVEKKDGEYNVTLETMKSYNRPRNINQPAFEDKDPISYKIGRTDIENAERKKRKERAARRLEREQRAFIQSTFHDMCKDICLKTYQQALGLLPYQEDPSCPCAPENPIVGKEDPGPGQIDLSHSCSCTESTRSSESATDDDEWILEFTPPNAFYNPAHKGRKIPKAENGTQYSYLDYKVKLVDLFGNPVPRFFLGPSGKQECSDLGGFWGPDKQWLEINVDGFVGPDAKWAPINFTGPCGEQVDAEGGKFQATNGVWLVVGVDGYVDGHNQWHFYPKPVMIGKDQKKIVSNVNAWKNAGGCKGQGNNKVPQKILKTGADIGKQSEAPWSCFGDTSPRALSQMGIVGHGHDRRLLLSTLEKLMAQGEKLQIPQRSQVPRSGRKSKPKPNRSLYTERIRCTHRPPSSKGIVAVDDRGRKTYFKLKEYKNPRPWHRKEALRAEGINLNTYHVPCLSSFISTEETKRQKIGHILNHNARVTQHAGVQT